MVSKSSVLRRRTFAKPDNYSPTTSKGNKCTEFPTGWACDEWRDKTRTRGLTPAEHPGDSASAHKRVERRFAPDTVQALNAGLLTILR